MPKLIQNSSTTKKIDIFTKDDVLKKCLLCHENMDLDSSREILDARWHYSECYFNKGSFMKKYPPVTKDLDKKQYTCPYMADGCTQRLTCLMVYMEFCLHYCHKS